MSDWRAIDRLEKDVLGEGPLWVESENALYWVDILGRQIRRLTLSNNEIDSWEMPEPIGWLIQRRDAAGFIAGFASGFAAITLDPLTIVPIGNPQDQHPANRMNDAKADIYGRIWAGTKAGGDDATGALFRLDPDLSWAEADSDYRIANGPAIAPRGDFLYHTDSAKRLVYKMDIDADGALSRREVFLEFPEHWGEPDGMTIDAEGGLWIAHWGGARVSRFLNDGTLDREISLPASQITSCTFAGRELDRMFVTSASDGVSEEYAGALFEVDPGVRGLPTFDFAG